MWIYYFGSETGKYVNHLKGFVKMAFFLKWSGTKTHFADLYSGAPVSSQQYSVTY